jgi:hypothetical protein
MEEVASLEFPFLLLILTFSFFQVLPAINMEMYYTARPSVLPALIVKGIVIFVAGHNRNVYGKNNTPGKKYQAFLQANKTAARTAG